MGCWNQNNLVKRSLSDLGKSLFLWQVHYRMNWRARKPRLRHNRRRAPVECEVWKLDLGKDQNRQD